MIQDKFQHIRGSLRAMGSVVVAFSGGVDSSLLAFLATAELGDRAVAITAVSPSVAASELTDANSFARQFAINHVVLDAHELEDPRYAENSSLRCYWCKNETFQILKQFAAEHGFATVVDGSNLDDTGDIRPGRKAAAELGVRSPFVEAGITKVEIREMARDLGLPNWNKPAKACLASRIPHGTQVTAEALRQVELAEQILCRIGIRQYRVRHHGDIARIEVLVEDFPLVLAHSSEILAGFREIGYRYTALDLAGYRSGSMNYG